MKKNKLLRITRIVGIIFLIAMIYRFVVAFLHQTYPVLPQVPHFILNVALYITFLGSLYFLIALILSHIFKENRIKHWIYFITATLLQFLLTYVIVVTNIIA